MIPDFVYERLPYLYLLIGVIDVYYFSKYSSFLGVLSGVIFIITALIIMRYRYEHRTLKVKSKTKRKRL